MSEGCKFVVNPFKPSHCKNCLRPKVEHTIPVLGSVATKPAVSVKSDLPPIKSTFEETKVTKTKEEMQQEFEKEEEERKAKFAKMLEEKNRKAQEELAERQRKLDEQDRLEEERRRQKKEELAEKQRIAFEQAEQLRLQEESGQAERRNAEQAAWERKRREQAEQINESVGEIVEEVVEEVVSLPMHPTVHEQFTTSSPNETTFEHNEPVPEPFVSPEPVDEIAREEAYLDNLMKVKQKKFENRLHGGLDEHLKKEERKKQREEEERKRKEEEANRPPPVYSPKPMTIPESVDDADRPRDPPKKKIPVGGVMMQGFNPMALAEESKKKLAAIRAKRGLEDGEQEAQSGTAVEKELPKYENPDDFQPMQKQGMQGVNLFGSGAFAEKLALRKSKLDAADESEKT